MQHNEYRAYFEHLATEHTTLAHDPSNGKKTFFYGSEQEFVTATDFQNNRLQAVLYVEDYQLTADDSNSNNINWIYRGTFSVLKYMGSGMVKYEEEQQILHELRDIMEQIVARIYYDHTEWLNGRLTEYHIRHFTPEDAIISKVDNELSGGYSGWICELEFCTKRMNLDKTVWEDL